MDDNIFIRFVRLPSTVHGVTVKDENGDFNIYINQNLSKPAQDRAVKHELMHIERGDFYSDENIILLEDDMP